MAVFLNKTGIATALGILGSIIASALGGWSNDLRTLIILMGIDFVTGVLVAAVFKKSNKSETGALESKAGWKGVCRKCTAIMFILFAHQLDTAMGMDYIRTATIIGFIFNESVSIVENAGLMGIWLPPQLIAAIDILKNKADINNKKEDD